MQGPPPSRQAAVPATAGRPTRAASPPSPPIPAPAAASPPLAASTRAGPGAGDASTDAYRRALGPSIRVPGSALDLIRRGETQAQATLPLRVRQARGLGYILDLELGDDPGRTPPGKLWPDFRILPDHPPGLSFHLQIGARSVEMTPLVPEENLGKWGYRHGGKPLKLSARDREMSAVLVAAGYQRIPFAYTTEGPEGDVVESYYGYLKLVIDESPAKGGHSDGDSDGEIASDREAKAPAPAASKRTSSAGAARRSSLTSAGNMHFTTVSSTSGVRLPTQGLETLLAARLRACQPGMDLNAAQAGPFEPGAPVDPVFGVKAYFETSIVRPLDFPAGAFLTMSGDGLEHNISLDVGARHGEAGSSRYGATTVSAERLDARRVGQLLAEGYIEVPLTLPVNGKASRKGAASATCPVYIRRRIIDPPEGPTDDEPADLERPADRGRPPGSKEPVREALEPGAPSRAEKAKLRKREAQRRAAARKAGAESEGAAASSSSTPAPSSSSSSSAVAAAPAAPAAGPKRAGGPPEPH